MFTNDIVISNIGVVTFAPSSRAKYLRITVSTDRKIKVTVPRHGNLRQAKQFLLSKKSWLQKQLQKIDQCFEAQIADNIDVDLGQAQQELFDRLDNFSKKHNLPYNRVVFRCQKTKWGSCSGKNNISLNINICFLPENLQNYILLHELVHTRIKNHSKIFWAELDKYTQGKAKEIAKELKNYRMKITR